MAQGVKLSNSDISDALIDCDGIITAAAKKLGMARQHLSSRISEEPELQPLLKSLRNNYEDRRKDQAENIFDKLMNQWEKYPRLAYQSACYILDNTAKDRGYNKPTNDVIISPETARNFEAVLEQLKASQSADSDLNICATSNNDDHKS